jgi:CRP-like cAMP-binding protein
VVLEPGSVINGTAMLAGGSCETTIRTQRAALLCEIDHATIEKFLQQHPERGSDLSQRVAEQLSREIANGQHRYYQQNGITSLEELKTMVFKNLRRSYAHLKLT